MAADMTRQEAEASFPVAITPKRDERLESGAGNRKNLGYGFINFISIHNA
jgi:hypothetical protein